MIRCSVDSVLVSVLVWDLETVPDLVGFAAANDLVGKSDVEIREAIGDKFPKHIYHSIVCIGASSRTESLTIGQWAPLARPAFCNKIAELSPPTARS